MSINIKKIGKFLKSVDGAEFIYLRHTVDMRNSIHMLIKAHKIQELEICDRFRVPLDKYHDFIMGNFNYSVHDMAVLNAMWIEYETKKLEQNPLVKIGDNSNNNP